MEIEVLAAALLLALAADCQRVPLRMNLNFLGVHARQRCPQVIRLGILVDVRLDRGSKGRRRSSGCCLAGWPAAHHAVKDLVKIPAEVEQILEQATTRNYVGHDIPPDPKRSAPRKRGHVMARATFETLPGKITVYQTYAR